MTPAAELHSVKSLTQTTSDEDVTTSKDRARAEMYALLTYDSSEAGTLEGLDERLGSAEQRRLRRECDRIRLEESLGWDTDLTNRAAG